MFKHLNEPEKFMVLVKVTMILQMLAIVTPIMLAVYLVINISHNNISYMMLSVAACFIALSVVNWLLLINTIRTKDYLLKKLKEK